MIPHPLRASRVAELLGGHRLAADLHVLGIVDSTNDLVRDRGRRGPVDGLVVAAEGQRAGRGRRGTSWTTPPRQAVLVSVLVTPPPDDRRLLAPAAGLAVADALAAHGADPRLKWPNDVLADDRKLGGVLIELSEADDGTPFAVVGIGINANQDPGGLPRDAAFPAGSLRDVVGHPVDREALLADLLRCLATRVDQARAADRETLRRDWAARDALIGRTITLRAGDRQLQGEVVALDPVDALTVRTAGGEVVVRAEHAHVERVSGVGDRPDS